MRLAQAGFDIYVEFDTASGDREASLMNTPEIQRVSLHGEVVARLREMIEEGELRPGERISERLICERLKISRTPLREALKVLSSEGLVEILLNRGARVVSLTEDSVREVFEVMGALEGLAGRLACACMSDAAIAEVVVLNDRMSAAHEAQDLRGYFRLNREIHERIIRGTNNTLLETLYSNLNARIRHARYAANRTPFRWDEAMREHDRVVEALARRDAAALGDILAGHLARTYAAIIANIKKASVKTSAAANDAL